MFGAECKRGTAKCDRICCGKLSEHTYFRQNCAMHNLPYCNAAKMGLYVTSLDGAYPASEDGTSN